MNSLYVSVQIYSKKEEKEFHSKSIDGFSYQKGGYFKFNNEINTGIKFEDFEKTNLLLSKPKSARVCEMNQIQILFDNGKIIFLSFENSCFFLKKFRILKQIFDQIKHSLVDYGTILKNNNIFFVLSKNIYFHIGNSKEGLKSLLLHLGKDVNILDLKTDDSSLSCVQLSNNQLHFVKSYLVHGQVVLKRLKENIQSEYDIIFYQFSKLENNVLFLFEFNESRNFFYLSKFKINVAEEKVEKISKKVISQIPPRKTLSLHVEVKMAPNEQMIFMCWENGKMLMYSFYKKGRREYVNITENRFVNFVKPKHISWHKNSGVIAITFLNKITNLEEIVFIDNALKLLKIKLENDIKIHSLNYNNIISKNSKDININMIKFLEMFNTTVLLVIFSRGPICLLKISSFCGPKNFLPFSNEYMVHLHLSANKTQKAFGVIRSLTNFDEIKRNVFLILHNLLINTKNGLVDDLEISMKILKKYSIFFKEEIYFMNVFYQFFVISIQKKNYFDSYIIAEKLNSKKMFKELYKISLENKYEILSVLTYKKLSQKAKNKPLKKMEMKKQLFEYVKKLSTQHNKELVNEIASSLELLDDERELLAKTIPKIRNLSNKD